MRPMMPPGPPSPYAAQPEEEYVAEPTPQSAPQPFDPKNMVMARKVLLEMMQQKAAASKTFQERTRELNKKILGR